MVSFWAFLLLIPLLIIAASACYADELTQTDWSGGPGVLGPVISIGDDFYCDTGTSWASSPGNLVCAYLAENHFIGPGSPLDVCTGDFNGDGHTDAASAHWWHDRVDCHLSSDGSGTQWDNVAVVESYDYARSITAGDMDGDGLDDIVASARYDDVISVFFSPAQPGGPWERHDIVNGMYARFLDTSDINGDGNADILGTTLNPDCIYWWENSGTGTDWTQHEVVSGLDIPRCARARDVDQDGDLDILSVSYGYGYVVWLENEDGSGETWTGRFIDNSYQFASSVDAADIDMDGDMDVFACSYVHGTVTLWLNEDGAGTAWSKRQIGSAGGVETVTAVDVDLDGDADVAASSAGSSSLFWLENVDGCGVDWALHGCAQYEHPEAFCVSDINGDGRPDFVACSNDDGSVEWWDHVADRYEPQGRLESSIVDATGSGSPIEWGTISWNGYEPAGTSIAFQVRSSDDPLMILQTSWSETISSPGTELSDLFDPYDSYFQYKAILGSNTTETPVLEDVTLTWNSLGIGMQGTGSPAPPGLYPAANPFRGIVTVAFVPVADAGAEIMLLDISGRVLRSFSCGQDECGSITVDALPAGVYSAVMRSGGRRFTEMLTVLP